MDINTQNKIIQDYQNGYSVLRLEKKYNITYWFIRKILRENNITIENRRFKRYQCNEDYFTVINSAEKAYWLGFLYADGCVYYNKHPKSKSIRIGGVQILLSYKDIEMLKKFNKSLGSNYPIKISTKKDGSKMCFLRVSSVKLGNQLNLLGCYPAKTFKLTFPSEKIVSQKYLRDFIRGYFDGDGSISYYIHPVTGLHKSLSITSSDSFIKSLDNYLNQHHTFNQTQIGKHATSNGISIWKKTAILDLKFFYNWLYENSDLCLNRKREKFEEIFSLIKNG